MAPHYCIGAPVIGEKTNAWTVVFLYEQSQRFNDKNKFKFEWILDR